MKKTIVIDFDGTLSDLTHRLHFIKGDGPKNWDHFFDSCIYDLRNEWCANLMNSLKQAGYKVLIVSGRPERCRKLSEIWLLQAEIAYDELVLVRKDGNHAPDDLLKEQWLKSYGAENIEFVVDDRQRVVDMWRRNGVVCLQCNAWEE